MRCGPCFFEHTAAPQHRNLEPSTRFLGLLKKVEVPPEASFSFTLTLTGDETGKQNWHILLFFVWSGFVYRVASLAILWCFVHAGVSFELRGRRREGIMDAAPSPKGVDFL